MRQCGLLSSRPTKHHQDLFHILLSLDCGSLREKILTNVPFTENEMLISPISPQMPIVNFDAFRNLLRTLAGLEDFARTNAHFWRRELHPALHNSTWDRSGPQCVFHKNQHRLDSERHKFLDCPLNRASRLEFFLLTTLHFFFDGHRDKKLAVLVARVREDPLSLNTFARFFLRPRRSVSRGRSSNGSAAISLIGSFKPYGRSHLPSARYRRSRAAG